MRCIFGLILCVALCFGGLHGLAAVAGASAKAQHPGMSPQAAEAAGWKVVYKYHAVVYVAAGVISLAACSLPSLLSRQRDFDEAAEYRRIMKAQGS